MKVIHNAKVVLPKRVIDNGYLIYDNLIREIGEGCIPQHYYDDVIDANNHLLIPGLIDIHCHGNNYLDTMDSSLESIKNIADYQSKNGITSFLPTTLTSSIKNIKDSLTVIKLAKNQKLNSRVLGAHLEGPFVNVEKKGAQNEEYIIRPSYELIKDELDIIRIISYAPEIDISDKFLRKIKEHNSKIVMSAAHTNCDYNRAIEAITNGLDSLTHIFNGMTKIHHREPGIILAGLNKGIFLELIADKIHVHPAFYSLFNQLCPHRVILISDAMKATGVGDGCYKFSGQDVVVKNGIARLKESGSLAGSTLTLNRAIRNYYNSSNCSINNAVNAASLNPACLLNISDKYGSLEIGKLADLVLCDIDFNVKKTVLAGNTVYQG